MIPQGMGTMRTAQSRKLVKVTGYIKYSLVVYSQDAQENAQISIEATHFDDKNTYFPKNAFNFFQYSWQSCCYIRYTSSIQFLRKQALRDGFYIYKQYEYIFLIYQLQKFGFTITQNERTNATYALLHLCPFTCPNFYIVNISITWVVLNGWLFYTLPIG